jgi:hypothetical protein
MTGLKYLLNWIVLGTKQLVCNPVVTTESWVFVESSRFVNFTDVLTSRYRLARQMSWSIDPECVTVSVLDILESAC